MKERFYKFIKFMSEIHIIEYATYTALTLLTLELCEMYCIPFNKVKIVVLVIIAGAFMNTWEIESKKKRKENK